MEVMLGLMENAPSWEISLGRDPSVSTGRCDSRLHSSRLPVPLLPLRAAGRAGIKPSVQGEGVRAVGPSRRPAPQDGLTPACRVSPVQPSGLRQLHLQELHQRGAGGDRVVHPAVHQHPLQSPAARENQDGLPGRRHDPGVSLWGRTLQLQVGAYRAPCPFLSHQEWYRTRKA